MYSRNSGWRGQLQHTSSTPVEPVQPVQVLPAMKSGSVTESPWPMVACICTEVPIERRRRSSFASLSRSTCSLWTSMEGTPVPVENQISSQQRGYFFRPDSRAAQFSSTAVLGILSLSIMTGLPSSPRQLLPSRTAFPPQAERTAAADSASIAFRRLPMPSVKGSYLQRRLRNPSGIPQPSLPAEVIVKGSSRRLCRARFLRSQSRCRR